MAPALPAPPEPLLAPIAVASPVAGAVRRVSLQLEMLRVEAPAGSFRGNSGIWELLDEAPAPAARTVMLRGNGFRYAIGSAETRSLLKQRLDALPNLRVARDRGAPAGGLPVEIEVTDQPRDCSAFLFDAAGRMRGLSFESARPIFQVFLDVRSLSQRRVELRIVPELREPAGPRQFVRKAEGWTQEPEYRGRVFDDLALTAVLSEGEFVVIGPAAEVRSMPLLGTPFFVLGEGAAVRENLYVVIPHLQGAVSGWNVETALATTPRRP